MNILTRLRFRKDDPMRELHVPKRDRLDDDGDPGVQVDHGEWVEDDSTAIDRETGDDTNFDRDKVRGDPSNRGRVVSPEDLQ